MGSPPRGIKVRVSRSYQTIEREAKEVIHQLIPDRDLDIVLPGIELFEEMTTCAGEPPFSVPVGRDQSIALAGAVTDIPGGQLGRTRFDRKEGCLVIEFSELAYRMLQSHNPRGRSTLYHELGHAFLHTKELLDLEYIEHERGALARCGSVHEIFFDSEWQADTFAFAALAPLELLRKLKAEGTLNPEMLAIAAGISRESASFRINNAIRKQGL